MNRREFLKVAVLAGGAGALLLGCTNEESGKPQKGGTLEPTPPPTLIPISQEVLALQDYVDANIGSAQEAVLLMYQKFGIEFPPQEKTQIFYTKGSGKRVSLQPAIISNKFILRTAGDGSSPGEDDLLKIAAALMTPRQPVTYYIEVNIEEPETGWQPRNEFIVFCNRGFGWRGIGFEDKDEIGFNSKRPSSELRSMVQEKVDDKYKDDKVENILAGDDLLQQTAMEEIGQLTKAVLTEPDLTAKSLMSSLSLDGVSAGTRFVRKLMGSGDGAVTIGDYLGYYTSSNLLGFASHLMRIAGNESLANDISMQYVMVTKLEELWAKAGTDKSDNDLMQEWQEYNKFVAELGFSDDNQDFAGENQFIIESGGENKGQRSLVGWGEQLNNLIMPKNLFP